MTQLPLFTPISDWRPPTEFPRFRDAKRIAIDVETCDPTLESLGPGVRRGAYIAGIALAIDGGPSYYFPIRHLDSIDNLELNSVINWFEEEARYFRGEVCGANLLYDLDFLAEELITFPRASAFLDVQIAEALLDEHQKRRALGNLAQKYLGLDKQETLLNEASSAYGFDPKGELWKLPARYVGRYAEADVELPLAILKKQEVLLKDEELLGIWKLECDVLPVMLKMIRYGVRIDEERLEACHRYFNAEEEKAYVGIQELTGVDLRGQIAASRAVADVLRRRGIVLPVTEKSNAPMTRSAVLESFDDEVCRLVLRARKFSKADGTFYRGVKDRLVRGRLHSNFRQVVSEDGGTVSGRLASSQPNIQNQPVRDKEIGRMWRSIYVPEPGNLWLRADYKAQEPRLFLHYSVLTGCTGAKALARRWRENPDLDPYAMICDALPKDDVKIVFLGRSYGMGDEKLRRTVAASLAKRNITKGVEEQVSAILYQFNTAAPYVPELTRKVTDKATQAGFIRTILGRKCRFPGGEFVHKATNRLIQGSAADQTKQAMVNLDRAGWIPHMAIHDELGFSVPNENIGQIKSIMEDAVKLAVPVVVDCNVGESWGAAK